MVVFVDLSPELKALLDVRRFSWRVVALLYLLDFFLVIVANGWLGDQIDQLWPWDGIIQSDLIVNLVIIGLILTPAFWLAKARWRDLGLDSINLRDGLIFALLCFDVCIIAFPLLSSLAHEPLDLGVRLNAFWVGQVITLAVGVAFTEELLYRSFHLRQMYLRFRRSTRERVPIRTHSARLGFALIASQLMFAFAHLPARLAAGSSLEKLPLELFILFSMGLLFSFVYLRTQSLAAAIGAHFLYDFVAGLPGAPVLPVLLVNIVLMLVTLVWPLLPRGRLEWRRPITVHDSSH
jgi:membrane protease YdiL (CAAX protease family)